MGITAVEAAETTRITKIKRPPFRKDHKRFSRTISELIIIT